MLKNIISILSALIILMAGVEAATIHGNVYDLNLDKLDNVVVEVNSEPKQRMISKDGWYSFTLNPGNYVITATYKENATQLSAEELVTIKEEGAFVLDLFMFPDIGEEQGLINESEEISVGDEVVDGSEIIRLAWIAAFVIFGISVLGIAALGIYMYRQKKKTAEVKKAIESGELDEELNELLEFVRKEGGRATQKDIRKNFPQSEAKISLMVTELEHKGYLEKIKKGRGNVIILKK
ncbi:MAG TPA: hypothetical protein VJI46_05980 [Candidatus Nanoarchaeia archaeon]|nr:hypothetical protein [Candidatus Nanoarchaeia archaeon]